MIRVPVPWASFALPIFLACGGGTPNPHDTHLGNECTQDKDCDDGLACTRDLCIISVSQTRSCWHEPIDDLCAAGETCQDASSSLPGCQPLALIRCLGLAPGDVCEPADPCATDLGLCTDGLCVYPVRECAPLPCGKSPGCNRDTGDCDYADEPDGESCHEDGDRCRPGYCKQGFCIAHDLDCDDETACTHDSCDPEEGCIHDPLDGDLCEDGDLCHGPDSCLDGICAAGPDVSCDDGDPCTGDACDPASGCVNQPLSPCCGNGTRESGESCDEGLAGTPGCSPACTFLTLTLAQPPVPGRSPAVAWSAATLRGLMAYEVLHGDGGLTMEVVPIDDHAAPGQPLPVLVSEIAGDFQTHAPALGALDPSGTFLLASYGPDSVDLRVLSKDGSVQLVKEGAFPLEDAVPFGRIRVGTRPEVSAVAWESRIECPDQSSIWTARVAPVVAGPGSLLTVAPTLVAGACDPKTRAVLGRACPGSEAVLVTLGIRTGTLVHQGSVGVVPVTPTGVGAYRELAVFEGDLVQPPTCVAAMDGTRFLLVYMLMVTSPGSEGKAALQLWSRFVDASGEPDGPPTIIQTTAMDPEDGYQVCFPGFASLAQLGDDGYLLVCPVATMGLEGAVSSMTLSRFVLNLDGLLVEGPVPFEGQTEPYALAVETVSGPGTSALVVWHGRPDMVDFDPLLPPPY